MHIADNEGESLRASNNFMSYRRDGEVDLIQGSLSSLRLKGRIIDTVFLDLTL
jgi:hypothetical protein